MPQEADAEPMPTLVFFGLILSAALFTFGKWLYQGRSDNHLLWIAIGFLLFTPRAYAFRGYRPGTKLPFWTGVLAAVGLAAMLYGLALRWA